MMTFDIKAEFVTQIHWNSRGSCGNSGCADPECCCSLCARPIGVSEDDPRWEEHPEDCDDCDLCRDCVPVMLFRGEGKTTQQAQFHQRCFERITDFNESRQGHHAGAAGAEGATP